MSRLNLPANRSKAQVHFFAIPGKAAPRHHTKFDKTLDALRDCPFGSTRRLRQPHDIHRLRTGATPLVWYDIEQMQSLHTHVRQRLLRLR